MAITDLQISEELMTDAPSIKYRGNEGPKSPEEERMMMVDEVLDEAYEQYIYDLLEQRPDATPMSKDEFRRMVIFEGMMSGGNPLPSDPTEPVNPFKPKPIGPVLPDKREMAAFGGIMGADGRRQYGIGSIFQKLKDIGEQYFTGKTAVEIENESQMRVDREQGINRPIPEGFDFKTQKIAKLPVIGDPEGEYGPQEGFFDTLFKGSKTDGERREGGLTEAIAKSIVPVVGGITAGLFTKNQPPEQLGVSTDDTQLKLGELKQAANVLDQKQGLAAGLNFLPPVAARQFTPAEMVEQYAKETVKVANGGRIGMAEGGIMDLGGLEKDYRNTGGFVEIGAKEKADDVPARLSVNEFVFTADAVRNAGGGDIDEGAKVMENVMKHLEGGGQLSRESQGMGGARDMFAVSERLSEVV